MRILFADIVNFCALLVIALLVAILWPTSGLLLWLSGLGLGATERLKDEGNAILRGFWRRRQERAFRG